MSYHYQKSNSAPMNPLKRASPVQERLKYSYSISRSRIARHCESCGQQFISTRIFTRLCPHCSAKRSSLDAPSDESLAPAS